jgi:hemoglobin
MNQLGGWKAWLCAATLTAAVVGIVATIIVLSGKRDGPSTGPAPKAKAATTLYNQLGGIFGIAAVVDDFSNRLLDDPLVGRDSPNAYLRNWTRTQSAERLPGLKWLRTLWVAALTGGPYTYVGTRPGGCPFGLERAHAALHISGAEFDAVAAQLAATLADHGVATAVSSQVLAAFAAHKAEVTTGASGAPHC